MQYTGKREIQSVIPEGGSDRTSGDSNKVEQICAVDFDVDNIVALTNNCGLQSMLYKGGTAKVTN